MFASPNSILTDISADQPIRRFLRIVCIVGMIAGYLAVIAICPRKVDPAPIVWAGWIVALYLVLCMVDLDTALGMLLVFLPLRYKFVQGTSVSVTDTLVLVLFPVVWLRMVFGGRTFRFPSGTGWILLWVAILLVSSMASLNPGVSVILWLRVGFGVLVLLIMRNQIVSRLQFDRLILWLVVSGLFLAMYGLTESVTRMILLPLDIAGKFNEWIRLTSILTQANETAWILVLTLPLTIAFGLCAANRRERFLWWAVCVVLLACILLTYSRGGLIGLLVVGFVSPFAHKYKWSALAVVATVVVLMMIVPPFRHNLMARSKSIERKLSRYRMTPSLAIDHPLLGYGLGTYKSIDELNPGRIPPALKGKFSHSLYITLIVETGLISTLIFGGLLVTTGRRLFRTLRRLKKRSSPEAILAQSLIAAFLGMLVLEAGFSSLAFLSFWILLAIFQIAPGVLFSELSDAESAD